jgi:Glyoxalase-like domain
MTELDHLIVAADTVDHGVAHVRAALGVDMPFGGSHPRMGTHNHLLRLGDALFLEVIAVDPAAPAPARPRWFQLDDPALQSELRVAPRLLTWVVRTRHMDETLRTSRRPLGAFEPMNRGDLQWLITIPADGGLLDNGLLPSLIQWPDGPHPASHLRDLGASLERFEAAHPEPDAYRRDLASIGGERLIEIRATAPTERPHLVAHIRTPHGTRILR